MTNSAARRLILLLPSTLILASCGTTDTSRNYRVPGVMGSLQAPIPSERYAPVRQAPPRDVAEIRRSAARAPSAVRRAPVTQPTKKPWYHIRLPSIKKSLWNDKKATIKKPVGRSYTPVPRQPIPGEQDGEGKE
jgi:hypothetical protein